MTRELSVISHQVSVLAQRDDLTQEQFVGVEYRLLRQAEPLPRSEGGNSSFGSHI
jgi:hypothetical protein